MKREVWDLEKHVAQVKDQCAARGLRLKRLRLTPEQVELCADGIAARNASTTTKEWVLTTLYLSCTVNRLMVADVEVGIVGCKGLKPNAGTGSW